MQYRKDKYGNDISALGYGCMRFTSKGVGIDFEKAEKEIMSAYQKGVNYYDTAYVYSGSEELIGEVFEKNGIREKVRITTKLPHYMVKKSGDIDRFFDEELKRLRTNHVEVYLIHMLTDINAWERLKGLGIIEWIENQKASGRIGQIGFSYHGNTDMFKQLIDAYDWDICQIQYNYMDEFSQAGRTGLDYAAEKGIPVVIMEPLRGGRLVNGLPKDAQKMFADNPHGWSPAEWALRWLWDQKNVTCVLSGMNSLEMVEENCKTASETIPGEFTAEDQTFLKSIVEKINSRMKVGCTGCRYCMPCPKGVDIPGTFSAYNTVYSDGLIRGIRDHIMNTAVRATNTGANNCIGCGKCEKVCPQQIEIRKELKNAGRVLEGLPYQIAKIVVRTFLKY